MVDADLADQVWELWDVGAITHDMASGAWDILAGSTSVDSQIPVIYEILKVRLIAAIGLVVTLLGGCAVSMNADEFYAQFPRATQSQYMTVADADVAITLGQCLKLQTRQVNARMGLTVREDLVNGAKALDGMVNNDGGNAHRILEYAWVPVGMGTQLQLRFDSLVCRPLQPQESDDSSSQIAT